MADKIHKKKKDWPHFDKIHLGGDAYSQGWDRIFGKKKKLKKPSKAKKESRQE